MKRVIIINDFKIFTEAIDCLYEAIVKEEDHRKEEYSAIGVTVPSRIPIQDLDLSQFRQEMLSVHKTLQWRGHNRRLTASQKNKARRVAISGICELIKDEYVGRFWDMYERVIGWPQDNTVYEWIWAKGFDYLQVDLIRSYYRREFVQTLVVESGVPKNRAKEIIEFFEIFWRYFQGQDVHSVIEALSTHGTFSHIPYRDRYRLQALAGNASEFSRAFALAVTKLSKIFEYVSSSAIIAGGQIEDWAKQIHKEVGIDPLSVLRDKEQLKKLYNRLLGIVTPEKIYGILKSKPPGTIAVFPDGEKKRTDTIDEIQLGQYQIDGALFTCQPGINIDQEMLSTFKESTIVEIHNYILVRSYSPIVPTINDQVRKDLVYKSFIKGRDCGYVFCCKKQPGSIIHVRTADNKLDTLLSLGDGFKCYPYLSYRGNYNKGTHNLFLKINSITLISQANQHLPVKFVCSHRGDILHEGIPGKHGRLSCGERSVHISDANPCCLTISATDNAGETIELDNGKAEISYELPEVMLFSPYSHNQIKPRKNGSPFLFGNRRFVLFTLSGRVSSTIELTNCEVDSTCSQGAFEIKSLTWVDQSLPFLIRVSGSDNNRVEWQFEKCFNCNLHINRTTDTIPSSVVYKDNQGNRVSDFDVVMHPVPNQELQGHLFWNFIFNDSLPVKVPFIDLAGGCAEGKSLRIEGSKLEKLLQSIYDPSANGTLEIAICTADETFVSRKIFLFPELHVKLPDIVRDGDDFEVKVNVGKNICFNEVKMKTARGRSRVKVKFERVEDKWRIKEQLFKGQVEVPSMGTTLSIESIPPYCATRFGDRNTGKVEIARDIFKRELEPYDLLIAVPGKKRPEVLINGTKQLCSWAFEIGNLLSLPLSNLKNVEYNENSILVKLPTIEKQFIIKYRLALINLHVEKYLFNGTVLGECSYRGPKGSSIKFQLQALMKDDSRVLVQESILEPNGKVVKNQNIKFSLNEAVNIDDLDYCQLSATLCEEQGTKGHQYGEFWQILPERFIGEEDFDWLKKQIITLIDEGRYFSAKKHLETAEKIVPVAEKKWMTEVKQLITGMIIKESLNKVTSQAVQVLKKEYLFEF